MSLARRKHFFLYDTKSQMSSERQALHQTYWEALPALGEAGIDSHADLRYWHQLLEDREKTDFEIFSDLAS